MSAVAIRIEEDSSGVFPAAAPVPPSAWELVRELLAGEPSQVLDAGKNGEGPASDLAAIGHCVTRVEGEPGWTDLSEPLPLLDETFDAIVIADGLQSVPDLGKAARELARLVKPAGFVVVTRAEAPVPRCSREDLERALLCAGFAIEEIVERHGEDIFVACRDETWGPAIAAAASATDATEASRALEALNLESMPPEVQREAMILGARALLGCGSLEGALDLASGADRIDPSAAGPMLALAELAGSIGDHATAVEACTEATRRGPDSPYTWQALARVREALGDVAGTIEAIERAQAAGPADAGVASLARAIEGRIAGGR